MEIQQNNFPKENLTENKSNLMLIQEATYLHTIDRRC